MRTESLMNMHIERYRYSAAILRGLIYVAGGKSDADSALSSVERYDPIGKTWRKVAEMNNSRANFALVECYGYLYAMGHHKSIERYDQDYNTWKEVKT